jgi:hypothetical protein
MELPDVNITSEMLWLSGFVTALIDIGLVLFLARQTQPSRFRQLHWPIVLAAGVFWMSYGLILFQVAWESFYARFLPHPADRSPSRLILELLLYPVVGLVLWWLAARLPGNPAVSFCLLGGLQSVPEHMWGICRLGMLDRIPFLQEVSPAAVLAFAVPEYILYWASTLGIALLIQERWQRYRHGKSLRARKKTG